MKRLIIVFAFLHSFVYSQLCPFLGPDQFLPCGVNSTTLTADLSQCGVGNNPNQTTNYTVQNIPYVTQTNTGTQLFMSDDSQQGPFNIGFNFCFYGQTYNQFWVGSNGWISFSPGQPTTFTSTPIPNTGFNIPKNCIMGPWQDWHPGVGGQIRYQVQGTAPCRKLIVSWIGVPMFSCTNLQGTFHIVIYESSNVIENYIQSKPNCVAWAGGTAVQGLHNLAGTAAVTVAGRNSTQWTVNNDAVRYNPSGPPVVPTITWYQVGNPTPIGTGPSINVTPPTAGANYTCQLTYPSCNAGWATCNGTASAIPDTVFVQPGPPSLPIPSVVTVDPACYNDCDGSVIITPNGGTGTINISWGTLGNSFNVPNLCAGIYPYNMIDDAGCTYSSAITINNPPQITINSIVGSDTVCFNSQFNPYNVLSTFTNLTYNWVTTNGSITQGQGTENLNLNVNGVTGGLYSNMLEVIGVDVNGCESLPESFEIFVLDLQPTIDTVLPMCEYNDCVPLIGSPIGGTFFGPNVNGNQFCPDSTVTGNNPINYSYTQSNCTFEVNTSIIVYPRPIIDNIINNLGTTGYQYSEICEGESLTNTYNTIGTGGLNTWYVFGDTIQSQNINLTWEQEGSYTFSVITTENGCVSYPETYDVGIQFCPQELIFIPNTFTPDGDELNQVWQPIFTQGYDPYDFEITIFNRWGEIVWVSKNASVGWDGTFNGKMCQDGVYIWIVEYGVVENDKRVVKRGHLTLLR
jgi:gliding motility-associated-like protein